MDDPLGFLIDMMKEICGAQVNSLLTTSARTGLRPCISLYGTLQPRVKKRVFGAYRCLDAAPAIVQVTVLWYISALALMGYYEYYRGSEIPQHFALPAGAIMWWVLNYTAYAKIRQIIKRRKDGRK